MSYVVEQLPLIDNNSSCEYQYQFQHQGCHDIPFIKSEQSQEQSSSSPPPIVYVKGIYFELGAAGRYLLKQTISNQPLFGTICKNIRQFHIANLRGLLRWAYDVGVWDDAVRLHYEYKGLIPMSEEHRMLQSLKQVQCKEHVADNCHPTIRYFPGIVLSLGAAGRETIKEMISHKLRRDAKLKKYLKTLGILKNTLRSSTIEQLLQLAWFTNLWDSVVEIHVNYILTSRRKIALQ